MTKAFTKREKILFSVLVIILLSALYYFSFALPTMNRISAADEKTAQLQDEIMQQTVKLKKIQEMQKEIEEAAGLSDGYKTKIPDYDNLENVMKLLDAFLGGATEYKLSFSALSEESSLLYRPIDVEFHCGNYAAALDIIQKIYTSPYKSVIDSISVDNDGNQDGDIVNYPVTVSMTVIFIEKK
jgi:Tfp pilus assembly protein PilO